MNDETNQQVTNSIFIVKVYDYNKETCRRYHFKNLEDAQLFHFRIFYGGVQNNLYVIDTIEEINLIDSADDVINFEEKNSTFHRAGT